MQLPRVLNKRFSDAGRSAGQNDGAEGLEHLVRHHGE
jgi:hypothetical protein